MGRGGRRGGGGGGGGGGGLQVAKCSRGSQPGLGSVGQDSPGRALPGCLVAGGAGLGLAKVSGKWVTGHCTLALYRP